MENNNLLIMTTINDKDEALDLRSYLLNKERIVYLNVAVDENSAFIVANSIRILVAKSTDPITLYINSRGGSVSDGLSILDAMQEAQAVGCEIATVATGMAASMGAFILAAGTKGKRYASANTKILLHQPLGGVSGQASDMAIAVNEIQKTKTKLNVYLAEFTGKALKKIERDTDRDSWFTAEEALLYGIIDHIGYYKS